jgi:C4-type Zn-finger protein
MANERIWESVDPDTSPCPHCNETSDKWVKKEGITLSGFSIVAVTTYHNPCGYKRTELRVDGKVAATLGSTY